MKVAVSVGPRTDPSERTSLRTALSGDYIQGCRCFIKRRAANVSLCRVLSGKPGCALGAQFGGGYEFHVIGRYEPLSMKGLANYDLSMDTGFNIDLN